MPMLDVPEACLDLSPIRIEDAGRFQAAAEQWGVKSHHYYFPRLLFGGQRKSRALLFEEVEGSILVYNLQRRAQEGRLELKLYLPPFPFSAAALQRAKERMRSFNRGRAGRIDWVQEGDTALVASHGFATSLREREFIYDRAAVAELSGALFRSLRRHLAVVGRNYPGMSFRAYAAADQAACSALYQRFRVQLQAKGIEPKGTQAMMNCLQDAARMPTFLMRGEVVEVDGVVRGYSFGGPISPRCGCGFLLASDHDYPGLGYAVRHRMVKSLPELPYFNDSTDNGRAGLREVKEHFRPVEMHAVHAAREVG